MFASPISLTKLNLMACVEWLSTSLSLTSCFPPKFEATNEAASIGSGVLDLDDPEMLIGD